MSRTYGYIPGQAEGAIPNGTRIRKKVSEEKDRHRVGDKGTILSSAGPILFEGRTEYGYFVKWDDDPQVPVFTTGYKIERDNSNN